MSLKGLEEAERKSKVLLRKVLISLRAQENEIKQELEKVRFLLSDAEQRQQWLSNPADMERYNAIQGLLNETESLYLSSNNSIAAQLFKDRMSKVLRQKMTNLESYEAEVRIRTAKIQEQIRQLTLNGLSDVKREAALREMYAEAHEAGGSYVNFNKAYLNDLVTLETKAAGSKTIGEYMKNLFTTYESSLRQTLVGGIVRGESYETMTQNLAKSSQITQRKAALLINTESNAIFNASVSDVITSNPLVKGYRFRAVLDSRTSKQCQELDGKYFPKEDMMPGVNYPPLHPNCRSTIVTVLVDENEKKDQRQRYTKNDKNQWEKVPPGMTYGQYKERFGFSNSTRPVEYEPTNVNVHAKGLLSDSQPQYVGYSKANRSAPRRISEMIDRRVLGDPAGSLLSSALKESGYDNLPTARQEDELQNFADEHKLERYVLVFDNDDDIEAFKNGKYDKPLEALGKGDIPEGKKTLNVVLRNANRVATPGSDKALSGEVDKRYRQFAEMGKSMPGDVQQAMYVQYGYDAVRTQKGVRIFNRTAVMYSEQPEAMPSVSPDESIAKTVDKIPDSIVSTNEEFEQKKKELGFESRNQSLASMSKAFTDKTGIRTTSQLTHLDRDLGAAVYHYTTDAYRSMNRVFRQFAEGQDWQSYIGRLGPQSRDAIRQLLEHQRDEVLASAHDFVTSRATSFEEVNVYARQNGIAHDYLDGYDEESLNELVGTEYVMNQTALSTKAVQIEGSTVVFEYVCPKGTFAANCIAVGDTEYDGEFECLLMAGQMAKIVGWEKVGSSVVVKACIMPGKVDPQYEAMKSSILEFLRNMKDEW